MKQFFLKTIGKQAYTQKKNFRVYVLRVSRQFSIEASLLLFGGLCETEKSFTTIKEETDKAFRAGYDRILLPWNFVYHPEKHKIAEWIAVYPEQFILAVHKLSFKIFQKLFPKPAHKNLCLELNLESYDNLFLQELENSNYFFYITIPAHKKMSLESLSLQLNKRYSQNLADNITGLNFNFFSGDSRFLRNDRGNKNSKKIAPVFVHFPCSHQAHPELYNSKEMYDFLKKAYYPPPPYDIHSLSIPKDLKLEPENKPELVYDLKDKSFYKKESSIKKQPLWNSLFKKHFSSNSLKASVIITAYNCEKELILCLEHLYQQDLPKKEWELIVLDDGSQKRLSQALNTLQFLKEMNFKFIFLPRELPRTGPKDHRFRAGIARNLGAKQARGKNLLFLDADILIPAHYISSVCQLMKTNKVIQHPRYHLSPSAPSNYKDINKAQHTFIKFNDYWENFYKTAENWNKKKLPWKYISTNTLCLKAKLFKQVGAFRKNYTCWGFEDTDLGYRLYQSGIKFKLSPIETYHLFRPSEFSNSETLRQELLGISALTFFHNTHDLSSYEEFCHLYKN